MTSTTRRRAAALLAGGAVVALTLGACGTAPHAAPAAAPAAAVAPAAAAAVAVAPVAVTAASSRGTASSTAPWGQVGAGWSAVSTSQHATADGSQPPIGPFTVSLVSPTGHRWTVGTSSRYLQLEDVTPDGGHVLARRSTTAGTTIDELDTRTGTWREVADGTHVRQAFYSQPTGRQVLVTTSTGPSYGGTERLLRLDRTGRTTLDVSYASPVMSQVAATPDGAYLVTGGAQLQVRDNATGAVVRSLPEPTYYHDCQPSQGWSGSTVSVVCDQEPGSGRSDVLLLDAATGRWTTAAHVEVNATRTSGYAAVWPTTSGTLAEERGLCSPGAVTLLDGEGRATSDLTWPGAPAGPQIAGVTGDAVYAVYGSCSTSTTRLVSQDVSSHVTRTLVTAPYVDAVVVDGR